MWSLRNTGTTETPNKLASAPAPSQVNLISPEVTLILQLYALLFIFINRNNTILLALI